MPRQKITGPPANGATLGQLPRLSHKQQGFVEAVAKGMSNGAAYRASYRSNGSRRTEWREGYRVRTNPKVATWLRHLQAEAAERGGYTLADHVADLDHLEQIAIETGNIGAAVQAAIHKGRALGLYVERQEQVTVRATDLLAEARRVIGPGFEQTELYVRLTRRATTETAVVHANAHTIEHEPAPVARLTLSPGETVKGEDGTAT